MVPDFYIVKIRTAELFKGKLNIRARRATIIRPAASVSSFLENFPRKFNVYTDCFYMYATSAILH